MRNGSIKLIENDNTSRIGMVRVAMLLVALFCFRQAFAADALWIDNPTEISYSVGELTDAAKALGLSNSSLSGTLADGLSAAGLTPKPAAYSNDKSVLFLDIIVEEQTYYASLGFWRVATYQRPDGEQNSDFVIVWQDYSVGAHHDDPAAITSTIQQIIERFIVTYGAANHLERPLQAAANP
jgi:uncharacterized membrane protein YdfJ with MMPL/SSD domain